MLESLIDQTSIHSFYPEDSLEFPLLSKYGSNCYIFTFTALGMMPLKALEILDKLEPKYEMYTCAKICVELDLEQGMLEAILLTLDKWTHVKHLDYEQLPFKCKIFHEYGHFENEWKTNHRENPTTSEQGEVWKIVKKKMHPNKGNNPNLVPSSSKQKPGPPPPKVV